MGQKSSKRQSYTPGGKQDAGLPTASVAENGDIQRSGANGQVRLLSNKDSLEGDVITPDVMTTSSTAATAASSPPRTEKKKRKGPRFAFSLKRTGSGKRSKRGRKKEANGVRPTSYPPAPFSATGDQTTGPRATERDRKAQSMFVEVPSDDVHGEVSQVAPANDDMAAAGEVTPKPTSSKKSSTDSSASSSKGGKDRRKNGSQKHKPSSKKKDKELKKKSKKKKEEADKAKTGGGQDENTSTAAASSETAAETAALTAAAKGEEEGGKAEDASVPEGDTPQEHEPALQAASSHTEETNDDTKEAREGNKDEDAEPQATNTEEPVEEAIAVSVAAVSESDIKITLPDDGTEDFLAEPEEEDEELVMTAEQLLEEIEQTILSKERSRLLEQGLQNEARPEGADQTRESQHEAQLEGTDQSESGRQEETQKEETLAVSEGKEVELAGHVIHEDILELSDISNQATDDAEQDRPEPTEGALKEEAGSRVSAEVAGNTTEAEQDVDKAAASEVLQSSVEATSKEPSPDTVQQQEEELAACAAPSTESGIQMTENGMQQQPTPTKLEGDGELPPSSAQLPAQFVPAVTSPPPADTAQPAQDTAQPLTPAQLKALEKERKAAKKKEEKERARKEKEEKKRLKEETKREAKEKKRKEKEDKERRLREAKEKARASAHVAEEADNEAVEETVTAAHNGRVQATPGSSAPMYGTLQQQQEEKTVVVELQPGTSEDAKTNDQLNVGADTAPFPAPSFTLPPTGPPTSDKEPDESLLGSSVKEIISSIETSAGMDPKTYDKSSPPDVPDTPYPEEELMQQSSAQTQFSAPGSSDSPGPSSLAARDKAAEGEDAVTTPESSPGAKPTFPPEISDSSRSSVLRKIELGPRLRTAILRKSSSGAESEENRVSLTQPRHVQVSDLTPPPRKPRSRRPLEHTRDSSGNYCYSISSLTASPVKEHEPVIEEQVSGEACAADDSPPVSTREQTEKDTESKSNTDGVEKESEATVQPEVREELAAGSMFTSLSHSVQLSSSSAQTAASPEDRTADCGEDGVQLADQLAEDFASSGGGLSTEADNPALVAVASIVRAGQTEYPDTPLSTRSARQEEAEDGSPEQSEVQDSKSTENPGEADDELLQKVAAEVVVRVQKVAQEKASALELQDKVALLLGTPDSQVTVTSDDTSHGHAEDRQAEGGVGEKGRDDDSGDEEEEDFDNEVGLIQATVVCSAELVEPTAQCQAPDPHQPGSSQSSGSHLNSAPTQSESSEAQGMDIQVCPGADEQSQAVLENDVGDAERDTCTEPRADSETTVGDKTEATPSSDSNTGHQAERAEENTDNSSAEKTEDNTDRSAEKTEEDNAATDTLQLQQFNKNYYDISVVVDDDNDEENDAAKTQSSEADPPTAENAHGQNSHAQDSPQPEERSSSPPCGGPPAESLTPEVTPQPLPDNGQQTGEGQVSGQQDKVEVSVRCNGSHALKVQPGDQSIDALLRLHSGVNGEMDVLVDSVEHNNNVSMDVYKVAPERGDSAVTADTNDSRD
ncbi:hypothetical protein ACOMHN_025541 [Nucella lapillus]